MRSEREGYGSDTVLQWFPWLCFSVTFKRSSLWPKALHVRKKAFHYKDLTLQTYIWWRLNTSLAQWKTLHTLRLCLYRNSLMHTCLHTLTGNHFCFNSSKGGTDDLNCITPPRCCIKLKNSGYLPTPCVFATGVRAVTATHTLAAMQVTSFPPLTQSLLNPFILDGLKSTLMCTWTTLRDLHIKTKSK